jgi:excisionase family DNA binding protein
MKLATSFSAFLSGGDSAAEESSTFPDAREELLLSVNQVAEVLGIREATVYRLCERKRLPFVELSSCILVRECELERFIHGETLATGRRQ